MEFDFTVNKISSEDWILLRQKGGFPPFDEEIAEKALKNSIAVIGVKMKNHGHVGMLRIIGDYAYAFYFNDVIVDPMFQGMGLGKKLIDFSINYIQNEYCNDHLFTISLLANYNAYSFYQKIGFKRAEEIPMKLHIKGKVRGNRKQCISKDEWRNTQNEENC